MIRLQELPGGLSGYLEKLAEKGGSGQIPVYYWNDAGGVFFIKDYILRDNKSFEKTAPAGLYRGGGLLRIVLKTGQVVVYDERRRWLRLVGGIARFDEGHDLVKTAVREGVLEEIAILADEEESRLVPRGFGLSCMSGMSFSIPGWGITVKKIREAGLLSQTDYVFNDANKALEVVITWDLSEEDNLIILHSEDWWRGGRSGFTPFVVDHNGDVIGLYDGRHGFFQFPVTGIHPTLVRYL